MPMDLQYRNPGNRALLDLLDIPPGRVLDCGCGAGDNARLLRRQGWQVTGVTLDPAELVAATAECVATELADLSAGLPFAADGSFDLVLLSHILEHLVDPAALIAEARRVLAPGGRIAIALPNVAHFRQRAEHLLGRFEYTKTGVMDSTHVRFFTVDTARRLLETNGLAILASDASGGLPWWRSRRLFPRELVARADRWALANRPNLFAWQAVFLTVPAGGPVSAVGRRAGESARESARLVPAASSSPVSRESSSG
ncbi:class I SAM-dependent methyltransferase [Parafrankia discariae]|uniref:class I SAM-dependent methyltransferase n=1 Tax=Parafrankia discariae TaxID=365528 RepID=UPI0012B68AF9|nr:class I SAM-dependent methyltransferase [Parafrankia discariae]